MIDQDIKSPLQSTNDRSISRTRLATTYEMVEGKSKKGKKLVTEVLEYAKWWFCWGVKEAKAIPKDVPKGHFVVYVGEEWKRYVIEIGVLKHPLFKILLDSAEEMFGFANASKLYLPCNECVFLTILQCLHSSNL